MQMPFFKNSQIRFGDSLILLFLYFSSDILYLLPHANSKLDLYMTMEMDHIYFTFRPEPTYLPWFKQRDKNSLPTYVSHQRPKTWVWFLNTSS